ncbi:DNA repair/transcription protein Met18p/MMS19 [[Candida] jaroonii]|uniref:DNA repair/transcription protein Met18p/MMS19 n=1 Tax=[Candida] jaroonii TaxID=467808 RepID=A0ACA9Y852_9ASCO|nr:DNA repair/transcription protein Met18p/MMS19 [[Candida] jaroonii]
MDQLPPLITQFITSCEDPEKDFGATYSSQIANLISNDEISLLVLVQNLGDKLTSDDDIERSRSIHCLSSTLDNLPPNKLSRQDVNVMVEFFLGKFDDKPSIRFILKSLSILISFNGFNPSLNDNLTKILNKLVNDYDTSKHLAKIRYESFRVIESLLKNHQKKIVSDKNYCTLLIKAFLHIATGEKDPRNLILSFEICETINKNFQFDINEEVDKYFISELLDNTFCYFPISFKPPANDPYKITADQLKLKLRRALVSQDLFAKDLIQSLLEKLTSTNPMIRNDVLLTMLELVKSFQPETILVHWDIIWNGLKFEILHLDNLSGFNSNFDYLIPKGLLTIDDSDENKSVYLTLEIFNQMLEKIDNQPLDTIKEDLKEYLSINSKYFKNCVLLVSSLSTNSIEANDIFMKFLFHDEYLGKFINPNIEEDFEEDIAITINKQRDLIDCFGYALISYQIIANEEITHNALLSNKDNLIIFLGQLLQASSNIEKTLKVKIIQQYIKLIEIPSFLNTEEKKSLIQILNELVLSLNDGDILMDAIIEGMVKLIKLSNDEILKLIIEFFLPNLLVKIDNKDQSILKILERIIINYELLEIISIRLINKLDNDSEYNFKIIELILKLVYKIQNSHQFLMNSWSKFIPTLHKQILKDEKNIEIYSELIGLIVKYTEASHHQDIITQYYSIFYQNKADLNLPGFKGVNNYIIIFNKVLASIDKNVTFNISKDQLNDLINDIPTIKEPNLKIQYLQHLSIITNKFLQSDDFQDFSLQYNDLSKFEIWVWILKSFILRLDKFGMMKLTELLENCNEIPLKVFIKLFDILLKDLKIYQPNKELPKGTKIISKVTNLNVKLLYKQQMFNIILNKILSGTLDNDLKLNLLSILTKNIDANILKLRINEILPLVIESLKFDHLLTSTLANLLIIIESGNSLINDLPFLMKRLVAILDYKVFNEQIRTLALKCILELISVNEKDLILIYKTDLLNGLSASLDDPKRTVRKLTCDIRQELFELR